MKFVFTDKKVDLPSSVHAYAEKKIGKLDRYFRNDGEATVVFSVEKDRNNVELTIRSGGTILRVSESTSDMFASIDAAVSSMERQLRKNKTRLEKRLRQGAFERTVDEHSSEARTVESRIGKIVGHLLGRREDIAAIVGSSRHTVYVPVADGVECQVHLREWNPVVVHRVAGVERRDGYECRENLSKSVFHIL